MIKHILNKIKLFLTVSFVCLIFAGIYYLTYRVAEPKAYDFMTKNVLTKRLPFDSKKQIYGSDDIVIVAIDAKTVEKYRWPWKRDKNCKIFEYLLNYASAKVVVYDAIIANNDSDYPQLDEQFFNCLGKFKNLTVGFIPEMQAWENESFGKNYDIGFAKKFKLNVEDRTTFKNVFYESLLPFPKLYMSKIKYAGSVNMYPGFIDGNLSSFGMDAIFRTHEYILSYNNEYYPSLALSAFLIANNSPKIILDDNSLRFEGLNYKINLVNNGFQHISPVRYYSVYPSGYSHKSYSAVDIMDSYDNIIAGKKPIINPDVFKDKIVLVGANVPAGTSLNDNKSSPIRNNHPGVDYQATAIDNIFHNDFLHIIPQSMNVLLTIIGILLLYLGIKFAGLIKSVWAAIIIFVAYLVISIICFYNYVIINVITPLVMFIMTTIVAYTNKYFAENKNKEKVKNAMGKYMSEDVMKSVVQNIDNLGLGGKKATVTVLFSDIRGFTSISERMPAQQVSEILNEYFTEMEPIVTKYNGIINKFIGDAIMAVFGEPIQDENHARNAVMCGYEMLKRVEKLHKKWANENKPEIEIGIGVNTGEVFVGNIGSVNRMEYTVIGDTVNLASRLESYNKVYKTKMLISTATYNNVKDISYVIKIPEVQIRGKANKIDIYEVLKVILQE